MKAWTWSSSPLVKARNTALLSQEEMAQKMGVSTTFLSKIERVPEHARIKTLREEYKILPREGREIIKQYILDYFDQFD